MFKKLFNLKNNLAEAGTAAGVAGQVVKYPGVRAAIHGNTAVILGVVRQGWGGHAHIRRLGIEILADGSVAAAVVAVAGGAVVGEVNHRLSEPLRTRLEGILLLLRAGGDGGVARALEELRFFTTDVKILGVYPADSFREDHV